MAWVLRHKFFTTLFIIAVLYWLKNPANEFGYIKQGFAVYNRIPIMFFDCYIAPDGTLRFESDLAHSPNIDFWIDNHLTLEDGNNGKVNILLVGTGFNGEKKLLFSDKQLEKLRHRQLQIEYYSSFEAVTKYNALKKMEKPCSILLKIR